MRTTIRISEVLYREVQAQAAREGRTVGEVIEDALRAHCRRIVDAKELQPLPTHGGSGVLPGVDLGGSSMLRDRMDDEQSLEALR